ncbi:TetR/AcrR family transcriptional regulator [Agrobacterium vitis]|uniref:TetR family transcriptional regulator n=1 Tax=Agrobacterium vitis TaxID=373 RepID=A0AAE4WB74_AGRVI|nr:TetR/AcrR family transcriptional regulator [Agrobacterium vitis]MCF1497468.1 TetR/AcrR family transcriptional regulator [Allorhizobium sp. Av2]MCM2438836.1 TetR/AcrR family transcriptional regulator [Agrobacterium vitis]MUZ56885.1 TetR family transcriptional regulator [Agrobacterium vitis]MVA64962.1 TetR family transcriptional regulator [Agrobacterium vitis]MVA85978.1 TetR family transcriptional regulator [Agrobacterium vitis]
MTSDQKTLRRQPRQERSRDRIDDILSAAMELIGQKGSAAVTMRGIATASDMSLATVYHYFPNRTAVIATLFERYSQGTREVIDTALQDIEDASGIGDAAEMIVDFYYNRVRSDPAVQDLLDAVHADKALHDLDIQETLRQADQFSRSTQGFLAESCRQEYARAVYLLFQLASAAIRLALHENEEKGAVIIDDYRRLVRGRFNQFEQL